MIPSQLIMTKKQQTPAEAGQPRNVQVYWNDALEAAVEQIIAHVETIEAEFIQKRELFPAGNLRKGSSGEINISAVINTALRYLILNIDDLPPETVNGLIADYIKIRNVGSRRQLYLDDAGLKYVDELSGWLKTNAEKFPNQTYGGPNRKMAATLALLYAASAAGKSAG